MTCPLAHTWTLKRTLRPRIQISSQSSVLSTHYATSLKATNHTDSAPWAPGRPGMKWLKTRWRSQGITSHTYEQRGKCRSNFKSVLPLRQSILNSSTITNWNCLPTFASLRERDAGPKKLKLLCPPRAPIRITNILTFLLVAHPFFLFTLNKSM